MISNYTAKKIIIFIILFIVQTLLTRLSIYLSVELFDVKLHFIILSIIEGLSLIPFIFIASLLGFRTAIIFTLFLIVVNYQRIIIIFSKDSLSFYMTLYIISLIIKNTFIALIIKLMNNKFSFNVKSAIVAGAVISLFVFLLNYIIIPAIYTENLSITLRDAFSKEFISNYLMLNMLYTIFDCVFVSIINKRVIKKFLLKTT